MLYILSVILVYVATVQCNSHSSSTYQYLHLPITCAVGLVWRVEAIGVSVTDFPVRYAGRAIPVTDTCHTPACDGEGENVSETLSEYQCNIFQ